MPWGEAASVSEALCHPERPGVDAAGMEGRSRVLPWEIGVLASCEGCREGVRWARRSQQRAEGLSQRPEARTSEPGPMPWSRVPTEAQSWELRRPNDPGRRRPEVAMSRDSCVKRHRRARTRSDHRPQTLHSTPGSAAEHLNRRVRNRTHGGVGGREG